MGSPSEIAQSKADIDQQNLLKAGATMAFNTDFLGEGIREYYLFLCKICTEWKSKRYYSLFHALINASMTGKSRLATTITKTLMFGFYMNFGDEQGVPSPNAALINWVKKYVKNHQKIPTHVIS
jgi:hypothetical protein